MSQAGRFGGDGLLVVLRRVLRGARLIGWLMGVAVVGWPVLVTGRWAAVGAIAGGIVVFVGVCGDAVLGGEVGCRGGGVIGAGSSA